MRLPEEGAFRALRQGPAGLEQGTSRQEVVKSGVKRGQMVAAFVPKPCKVTKTHPKGDREPGRDDKSDGLVLNLGPNCSQRRTRQSLESEARGSWLYLWGVFSGVS